MASVSLNALEKRFGQVVAVDALSLEIRDKEFVTLLGPSGCGKTTTLRMIAGLESPTRGDIYFNDERVTQLPANHRDIAMVFQSYALYPHMNVYDNIGFALRMMKVPKDEIRRRVERAAAMLGIGELLQRKPRELSGGQRQRVALGRTIVREPAAYLLDEPLSNLDAQLRLQMRAELKKLHLELQRTFIYVTHDQAEALTMSDRIAIMHGGRLQQYATPDEIYNRPANMFVAGFMGSPPMNFLDGELVRVDGALTFRRPGVSCRLPERASEIVPNGDGGVVLGIRPESIGVRAAVEHDDALRGTVYIEEPMGSDTLLTVDLHGVLIKVRTDPDFRAGAGASVSLVPNLAKLHLFDKRTGVALF